MIGKTALAIAQTAALILSDGASSELAEVADTVKTGSKMLNTMGKVQDYMDKGMKAVSYGEKVAKGYVHLSGSDIKESATSGTIHKVLDAIGAVDPTGIADAINAFVGDCT